MNFLDNPTRFNKIITQHGAKVATSSNASAYVYERRMARSMRELFDNYKFTHTETQIESAIYVFEISLRELSGPFTKTAYALYEKEGILPVLKKYFKAHKHKNVYKKFQL
tara:strand:- start:1768 stop:2097 length:330 start_codon:yes stop_codon:yes gene_type:complete